MCLNEAFDALLDWIKCLKSISNTLVSIPLWTYRIEVSFAILVLLLQWCQLLQKDQILLILTWNQRLFLVDLEKLTHVNCFYISESNLAMIAFKTHIEPGIKCTICTRHSKQNLLILLLLILVVLCVIITSSQNK